MSRHARHARREPAESPAGPATSATPDGPATPAGASTASASTANPSTASTASQGSADSTGGPGRPGRRDRPAPPPRRHLHRYLVSGVLALVLVGAVLFRASAGPSGLRTLAARAPLVGAKCPDHRLTTTALTVMVAPELQTTVATALAPLDGETLPGRRCVQVQVQAQEPAQTVMGAQLLPLDREPDLWIPDSSLWTSDVPDWPLERRAAFASSPVVVASSREAVQALGWTGKAPTWAAALGSGRPIAVPQISASAAGLASVIALWQSLGGGASAEQALAGTVLAAGRSGVPTEQQAIAAAVQGSASAPLLPTSQQLVTAQNAAHPSSQLVAVHPAGGAPTLDYPILVTRRTTTSSARTQAIDAVLAQLQGARAQAFARASGFAAPDRTPVTTPAAELAELVGKITLLAAPSRMLVVFDLSRSMAAGAGHGMSRIQFAGLAAKTAGDLLTDHAQTGLWGFARNLKGGADRVELEKLAPLGDKEGKVTHREAMNRAMSAAAGELGGDGTALYATAVAGMKWMDARYDPRAGNAVVLFTDGADDNPGGPSLQATLTQLQQLYDPKKPVRLICIAIGTGADMSELSALASHAGGLAYNAKSPADLPKVLFQALAGRKP
jgi:hypothetical protein